MAFQLDPVDPTDFDRVPVGVVTARTSAPIDVVWEAVSGAKPLSWCTMLRAVTWTSPAPHGVGTTRTATLGPGVHLKERYIDWHEEPGLRRNAFTVVSSPFPGIARFGERYEVRSTSTGTEFVWSFLIEPKRGPLTPAVKLLAATTVRVMQFDTTRHFKRLG